MSVAVLVLDVLAIAAALVAAVLWFVASRTRLRRISRTEVLDAADINRIVVAVNRAQILSSRAAAATAVAAVLAAARLSLTALGGP